ERPGDPGVQTLVRGIVGGNAVGQREELFEPGVAAATEGSDVGPTIAARDDGTESDSNNIEEAMESPMAAARIAEFGEVGFEGRVIVLLRETGHPGENRRGQPLTKSRDCEQLARSLMRPPCAPRQGKR